MFSSIDNSLCVLLEFVYVCRDHALIGCIVSGCQLLRISSKITGPTWTITICVETRLSRPVPQDKKLYQSRMHPTAFPGSS